MGRKFKEFMCMLETHLPPICKDDDLVSFGLIQSINAACAARKVGGVPSYLKINHRIYYFKEDIIDWINGCYYDHCATEAERREERALKLSQNILIMEVEDDDDDGE